MLAGATLALLMGCAASVTPVTLDMDPRFRKIVRPTPAERPCRLIVLPPDTAPLAQGPPRTPSREEAAWRGPFDPAAFQKDIASMLEGTGAFKLVEMRDEPGEQEEDVNLTIEVSEMSIRYGGKTPAFLASALLSLVFPPAACLIAADGFSASCRGRWHATDGDGRPLYFKDFKVTRRFALDRFQCGMSPWELFLLIPPQSGFEPSRIEEIVLPPLLRAACLEITDNILTKLPEPELDVIISSGIQETGSHPRWCGEKDAKRFCENIKQREGRNEPYLCRGVKAAVAGEWSFMRILYRLRFSRGARIRDLIVYYAGVGTVLSAEKPDAPRPALFLHENTGGSSPLVAVPLDKILRLMEAIPAESRLLVVDAGFPRPEEAFIDLEPAPTETPTPGITLRERSPSVILACSPGETTLEPREWESGLLTHMLLQSLDPSLDANADGALSVEEIKDRVRYRMGRFLHGKQSHPVFLGSAPLFRLPREKTPDKNKDCIER